MSLTMKLEGMLAPNRLIGRTVWSTPQGGESCHLCKYWAPTYVNVNYDPAIQESHEKLVSGKCYHLRVLAAYGGKIPHAKSYFYCNMFEEKEKDYV